MFSRTFLSTHSIFFARLISFHRCLSTSHDLGAQLKGLNDRGEYRKALDIFRSNLNERQRTTLAVNQALKASIELGDLQQGEAIHHSLSPSLINNSYIRTNLIRLYRKRCPHPSPSRYLFVSLHSVRCGEIHKSEEIFDQTVEKTLPMYNNLLNGCISLALFGGNFSLGLLHLGLADHQRAEEGLRLFERMKNIERNEYTYSALFKICEKIGDGDALHRGQMIFRTMPKKYQQNPVLLTSFLQMLIKCGDLHSAEEFFNRMEKKSVFVYAIMMTG